jgi:hypothetical protein
MAVRRQQLVVADLAAVQLRWATKKENKQNILV